jgi:hypothetical protein
MEGSARFAAFGRALLGGWMADYLGVSLLALGVGAYDLVTRRSPAGLCAGSDLDP